jgi:nicotinate phosphoribosyltransferase
MSDRQHSLRGGILATDQYQLTMAQLYWKEGLAERPAQFDYFFRSYPDYGTHQAGYCIAAGLGWLLDGMAQTRFSEDDLGVLRAQRRPDGGPRFDDGFLQWLAGHGDFASIQVKAVPEGRVVHANVPIAIIQGPLAMTQILETRLLNHLNYPTLVATKASRIKDAARDGLVIEFGLRRGPDAGANAGTRAALIGGSDFTSNVALSAELGLDPKGTHAHSLVQVFMALGEGELEAFRRFADAYPDECVLLVDTVNVLKSGVPNAIRVFQELSESGHRPVGIRLDSGDLAYLAIQSAVLLDAAGFEDVSIVLSSDLDELNIWQILSQIDDEAPRYGLDAGALAARLTFGVGTRLITSHGDSSLGGVYKLVAVGATDHGWIPAIKVSEDIAKIPIPGQKQVFRFYDQRGLATADTVTLPGEDVFEGGSAELYHPHRDLHRSVTAADVSRVEDLLQPVFADNARTDDRPTIEAMRERRTADMERLDPGVRRLVNPHIYHVSVTERLKQLQQDLVASATGR